jgi:hypothetical protein
VDDPRENLELYLRELEATGIAVERTRLPDGSLSIRITVPQSSGLPDGYKPDDG